MGIIAKYKFNQTTYANFIPTFNSDFTDYTITDEIDTDGYTIRTISNDSGNLPTKMQFGSTSYTNREESLLNVYKYNISEVTDMSYMFYNCRKLTSLDLSNLDAQNVTNMSYMFQNCSNLTSLNLSNLNTQNVTNMSYMFYGCSNLTSLDLSGFNTQNVTNMSYMFRTCSKLTSLDLSSFNTEKVKNMSYMFYYCSKLTSLDFSGFNTQNVTNMSNMFNNCYTLISLDFSGFNTEKVTDMSYMFNYCLGLKSLDLSDFNTENVTDMSYMFNNCYLLTPLDLTKFNTQKVTNTNYMFTGWSSSQKVYISSKWTLGTSFSPTFITTFAYTIAKYKFNQNTYTDFLPTFNEEFTDYTYTDEASTDGFIIRTIGNDSGNLPTQMNFGASTQTKREESLLEVFECNTDEITSMSSMFRNCSNLTSLDLLSFNTENATSIAYMFYGCSSLISLDFSSFNTQNVNNMNRMFYGCSSLTSLDLSSFNTQNVNNMYSVFHNCKNLKSLDLSNFNTQNVTNMSNMFYGCSKLTSLDLSSFNTEKVTDTKDMFYSWTSSQKVYISSKWTLGTSFSPTFIVTFAYIIAKYKFNQNTNESFIPEFNTDFIDYTYNDEIDTDGYTVRTLGNDSGNLPTLMRFGTTTAQTNREKSLLEVFNCNTDEITDMTYMFYGCTKLTSLDLSSFDTENVNDMNRMFYYCSSLTSLNLSGFNTQNVKNMSNMFYNCSKLTSLNLSSFNTENVTNMSDMFNNCYELTSLNLSNFNTQNVTNMSNMFNYCLGLTSLDLSSFNTENVTNMNYMFNGCSKLTSLDLSNFNTQKVTSKSYTFGGWTSAQTVYVEPPFWSIGTTSLNSNINWVINITRNNGYWLDMTGITGATEITLFNENNLPTEEIITDWGDGTQDSELTHTYSTAGEYIVVSNLQLGQNNNKVNSYLTKATIYYLTKPYAMFYSCSKLTDVTLTDNWVELFNAFNETNGYTCDSMFYCCKKLSTLDTTQICKMKNITSMKYMFSDCSSLVELDLGGFDTSKVTSLQNTFSGCNALTSLNLNGLDLSSVTTMNSMCNNCYGLTTFTPPKNNTNSLKVLQDTFRNTRLSNYDFLNDWNLDQVTSFSSCLHSCTNMTSFSFKNKHLPSTTNLQYMFSGCTNLQTVDLSGLIVDNNVGLLEMFKNCKSLTSVDFSNSTIKPTSCANMFNGCSSLTSINLSSWDTGQCANMSSMFNGCSSLTSLDPSSWDVSQCTTMASMFFNCSLLKSLVMPKGESPVGEMKHMFAGCKNLTNIDFSEFIPTKLTSIGYMFSNCSALKEIDLSTFKSDNVTYWEGFFNQCSRLEVADCSNMKWKSTMGAFYQASKFNTLGLIYLDADSVNKWVQSFQVHHAGKPLTIYYHDADPSQLTPVEGVTFKKYVTPTTIQLPPHIQLHSLPDGTRDEVDIKTGILTRNVGYTKHAPKDLFGITTGFNRGVSYDATTERWIGHQASIDYTIFNSIGISNFQRKSVATAPISIYKVNSDWIAIAIKLAELTSKGYANTQEGFLDYISNEEIMAMYPLTTPTTEQLILNYNNSCDYGRILPTGMCDKYDVVNSMYTQTMTSILLDGANTWDAMEEFENTVKFTATGTTVGVENLNMLGAGGLYCDNDLFPNINDDSDVPHCRVDEAGNKFYIYVDKEMLMSPDLIGWQIWLQANNFNMIYELAEHLTYVKPYEELDPTQARWEGMDCMRDGAIKYHTNSSDNITMYPTLEYVAPSINNFEVTMLEPNTEYTIYAEGINTNDTINLGGTDINFNNGTVYTSGDNQWLRIDNNDSFYNMVITKGDTTGEVVPYFEGMTSVENPKVIVPTKNLAVIKTEPYSVRGVNVEVIDGIINLSGSTTASYLTWDLNTGETIQATFGAPNEETYEYFSDKRIEGITPNTYTVTMSFSENDNSALTGYVISIFVIYDDTKVANRSLFISSNSDIRDYYDTITVNSHINGFAMQRWYSGDCTDVTASIQIEKGNIGTNFAPAGGSTVSYTDLKLRSLPNGVKDTINVVTGEYVQRVGEVVFDGSEDWVRSAHTNSMMFYTSLNNLVHKEDYLNSISCDKFVVYADEGTLHDSISLNGISGYVDWVDTYPNENWLYIKHADSESSVEKFKQWLSNNPTTIQYELVEPIITKLDPQTLLAYTDGTINLSSDTGLLPTTHYTVPSTNTFHLPSMKTGTRYTLKYPSASGSITIGDINYSISSDSMLFTTPLKINGDTSAIIFSDTNPENVVLLEGAYNKREVPFFTGVKSVKNPNITIIDQLSTESTTYNCETEIELRGLPNGVADKLDIIKGKLTTNVGIRPYQEGDENLPNIWTDGYETVYALSSPVVTNVTIDQPTVTTNSLIELSSDYLIPQLNYRAPSSNNFPLDLLQPNTTYTLYADTLASGSYTLGGTKTGIYSQPHTITLGDMTDNLLTFNGDLGLSNVMLVKGNSLKTTLPPYFLGIRSVTDGHLLVEGMAGEMNELTFDEGIVLRDCNGVKDAIDLITCTLTKCTGEITLTGAEGWYRADNESTTDHNVFKLTLGGLKEALVMCDTLQSVFDTKMMDCIHAHTNELCIVIANATIGGNTVNALKSWLNQHPTTVVYQLRTPIEVQLENTWTTLPPTSYDNQTEISSTVSTNSLKPMISVTIATTTLEEIVSNLEAQNAQLEEENMATMLALTSVYETMAAPMAVATMSLDDEPSTVNLSDGKDGNNINGMSVSPIGMVYVNLIRKGLKTIDQVPYNLQAEVRYALKGLE